MDLKVILHNDCRRVLCIYKGLTGVMTQTIQFNWLVPHCDLIGMFAFNSHKSLKSIVISPWCEVKALDGKQWKINVCKNVKQLCYMFRICYD